MLVVESHFSLSILSLILHNEAEEITFPQLVFDRNVTMHGVISVHSGWKPPGINLITLIPSADIQRISPELKIFKECLPRRIDFSLSLLT